MDMVLTADTAGMVGTEVTSKLHNQTDLPTLKHLRRI